MKRTRTKIAIAVAALAAVAGGATYAYAGAGDDGDEQVTGPAANKARAAALAHLGGGTANSVERDSEDGAVWEVEVTKSGGDTVDVRLDGQYRVVTVEGDSESNDEGD